MDAGRRHAYLEALGIDEWRPRRDDARLEAEGAEDTEGREAQAEHAAVGIGDAGGAAAASTAAERSARAMAEGAAGERTARGSAITRHAAAESVTRGSVTAGRPAAGAAAAAGPVADTATVERAWAELRDEILQCTRCGLCRTRTQAVPGVGDIHAGWLIVGEAPGADEDRLGEPFVGRAGQLLDAMLRAIGLSRGEGVYIANVLKCRPPRNRDPQPEEVASCLPYLERQIALLRPALVLAAGRIAAQSLLGVSSSIARLRGRVHRFGALNTPLIVTYHPSYLLRTPSDKRKAWEDLKFARSVFRELTRSS